MLISQLAARVAKSAPTSCSLLEASPSAQTSKSTVKALSSTFISTKLKRKKMIEIRSRYSFLISQLIVKVITTKSVQVKKRAARNPKNVIQQSRPNSLKKELVILKPSRVIKLVSETAVAHLKHLLWEKMWNKFSRRGLPCTMYLTTTANP